MRSCNAFWLLVVLHEGAGSGTSLAGTAGLPAWPDGLLLRREKGFGSKCSSAWILLVLSVACSLANDTTIWLDGRQFHPTVKSSWLVRSETKSEVYVSVSLPPTRSEHRYDPKHCEEARITIQFRADSHNLPDWTYCTSRLVFGINYATFANHCKTIFICRKTILILPLVLRSGESKFSHPPSKKTLTGKHFPKWCM